MLVLHFVILGFVTGHILFKHSIKDIFTLLSITLFMSRCRTVMHGFKMKTVNIGLGILHSLNLGLGVCGVSVVDDWLRQPHLARVRLIGLWGWLRLHSGRLPTLQYGALSSCLIVCKLCNKPALNINPLCLQVITITKMLNDVWNEVTLRDQCVWAVGPWQS